VKILVLTGQIASFHEKCGLSPENSKPMYYFEYNWMKWSSLPFGYSSIFD